MSDKVSSLVVLNKRPQLSYLFHSKFSGIICGHVIFWELYISVVSIAKLLPEINTRNTLLLPLCILGNFSCFCCRLLTFFQNYLFQKKFSGTPLECQTVWIQIRTDVVSVLIWIQTVCKDYKQTAKVAACKERVNILLYRSR